MSPSHIESPAARRAFCFSGGAMIRRAKPASDSADLTAPSIAPHQAIRMTSAVAAKLRQNHRFYVFRLPLPRRYGTLNDRPTASFDPVEVFCRKRVDSAPLSAYIGGTPSPGGGIGRRARFRSVCRKAWRFESSPGHHPALSRIACVPRQFGSLVYRVSPQTSSGDRSRRYLSRRFSGDRYPCRGSPKISALIAEGCAGP